ncbi:MAG: hypothetical protein JO010_15065, partial [Alphaproteobacteria bacterium]|nr:hypothetical protein [Alphaproteobacteria bacterium]
MDTFLDTLIAGGDPRPALRQLARQIEGTEPDPVVAGTLARLARLAAVWRQREEGRLEAERHLSAFTQSLAGFAFGFVLGSPPHIHFTYASE